MSVAGEGGGDITRQVQEESLEAFIQREISQHQVTQDPFVRHCHEQAARAA